MPVVHITVDASPLRNLAADVRERLADASPWAHQVPAIIRFGPGSFAEQIGRRTFEDVGLTGAGGRRWEEPAYARGKRDSNEEVLWDAVLGRNAASLTVVRPDGASIGVRDDVLRLLYAYAPPGNELVSTAPYADPLLGGFNERTTPARAVAVKPVNRRRTSGRGKGAAAGPKPQNVTAYTADLAMYWRLLREFGYDATETELRGGLAIPPKNLGLSAAMLDRLRTAYLQHLLGADRLRRGASLDPRRRR